MQASAAGIPHCRHHVLPLVGGLFGEQVDGPGWTHLFRPICVEYIQIEVHTVKTSRPHSQEELRETDGAGVSNTQQFSVHRALGASWRRSSLMWNEGTPEKE
jgi:hypothetical protein